MEVQPMWDWRSDIQLHVQVVIEDGKEGNRRARLMRVPAAPKNSYNGGTASFSAHRWGETVNGWTPAINHTYIATIWLHWSPGEPDEITRQKVTKYMGRYLKNLMGGDGDVHRQILGLLPGTGWYFGRDFLK